MLALLQRVSQASVTVAGEVVGAIDGGLLVFLGVQQGDDPARCEKLAAKVMNYRIFSDGEGRMNRSVRDCGGGVLVVSQFTLAADTRKGLRPSFTPAAEPAEAQRLYDYFTDCIRRETDRVATGRFGTDMQVSLCNDGPVTFLLEV
ncbi:MAG: D-aminoacyl-tRNA deacylase [Porticoccaceae bacterium]|jgi:D-tyrosyl-tRNA(Tyr) deacylase|nr:D-aminoacyl-tRNA deacylase [Pseudomonadota bacterium]HLS98079.1 D-aminoacyl-tRNA deacylase [Porticoccaceae bacterium]